MAKYIVIHSIKVATDFEPETFGRLTTIGPRFWLPVGHQGHSHAHQACFCDCGENVVIATGSLRAGLTQSCGCLRQRASSIRATRHGKCGTGEYRAWTGAIGRCGNKNNQKYKDYGGRGIRVCDRWLELNGQGFANFLEDMGPKPSPKHSIDRIDVNGDYCPENCRWATPKEQSNNTRRNVIISINGLAKTATEWSEFSGIDRTTILYRLRSGSAGEALIAKPLRGALRAPEKRL